MNQARVIVDDQGIFRGRAACRAPRAGGLPDLGTPGALHGRKLMGEGLGLVLDPCHEPADRRTGGQRPKNRRGRAELVNIGDMFTTADKYQRQGLQNFSGAVSGGGGIKLGEAVLAKIPEIQGVEEACQPAQPCVGHQRLGGQGRRNGRKNCGKVLR